MKLSSLLGVIVLSFGSTEGADLTDANKKGDKNPPKVNNQKKTKIDATIAVEMGGTFSEGCEKATKWELYKLGIKDEPELLKVTTAESDVTQYELTDKNELKILANKKHREMMGLITCSVGDDTLASLQVTGYPLFENLANSMTNLNGDEKKRMDCAVSGYPAPTLSWRFAATDKEQSEVQCKDNACTPCLANCKPICEKHDDECEAAYYTQNSTSIFDISTIFTQIQMRYSLNKENACPMNSALIDETAFPNCKVVETEDDVERLDNDYLSKTQLYFPNVTYSQGGLYICVATQINGKVATDRTKIFDWRVKDPIAALWPFLALVGEVLIVVSIILYYERAAGAKKEGSDEEGGLFIGKKEES